MEGPRTTISRLSFKKPGRGKRPQPPQLQKGIRTLARSRRDLNSNSSQKNIIIFIYNISGRIEVCFCAVPLLHWIRPRLGCASSCTLYQAWTNDLRVPPIAWRTDADGVREIVCGCWLTVGCIPFPGSKQTWVWTALTESRSEWHLGPPADWTKSRANRQADSRPRRIDTVSASVSRTQPTGMVNCNLTDRESWAGECIATVRWL